ncbi:MAG: App1 family protein [Bacteroidales bacterium]|nr:App1 family protein [Bacteroidales bacterium]MDT8431493.1 App1 family protein [Bacteroidales bacterium]
MSVYLWQLNILQMGDKSLVNGTILRGRKKLRSNTRTIAGNSFQVMRSYFHGTYADKEISFRMGSFEREILTTGKGHFSFMADAAPDENVEIIAGGKKLEIPGHYPAIFRQNGTKLEIISDLDDTVMISHTASALKRITTILFYRPKKRKSVAYTHELFRDFQKRSYRITYLSKSESNLFGLITSVLNFRELPQGALLLTPFLKFRQLFDPKKGQDYKLNYLRRIISNMPDKKFILLGDDTQRDMDAYTQAVQEFPGRIRKIFIRQTGLIRKPAQEEKWNRLLATGVEAVYFQDTDEPGEEKTEKTT